MGPRHDLHLGDQWPECFGVDSAPTTAAADRPDGLAVRRFQFCRVQNLGENGIELFTHIARVDGDAHLCERDLFVGGDEQLGHVRPDPRDGVVNPSLRFLGSAPKRHDPAGRVIPVVRQLFDALVRDSGEDRIT